MAGRNRAGRRAAPRRDAGALLAAAAAGGAFALSGVLVLSGAGAAPAPAAAVAPAPAPPAPAGREASPAPTDPEPPAAEEPSGSSGPAVDPRAEAFLAGLAAADVPTSASGEYEVLVAAEVCRELAAGADEDELAHRIPPVLPTVTPRMAAALIDVAKDEYC